MSLLNSKKPLTDLNNALQKETSVKQVKSMNEAFKDLQKMPDIQVNVNRTGVEGRISPISDKPLRSIRTPEQERQEMEMNFATKQSRNHLIT